MTKSIKLKNNVLLDISNIVSNRQTLDRHLDCVEMNNVNRSTEMSITRRITRNSAVVVVSNFGIKYCAFLNSGGNYYSNGVQNVVNQSSNIYPTIEISNNIVTITINAWMYAKVFFI